MVKRLKRILMLHLDLESIVIIFFILLCVFRPLTNSTFSFLSWVSQRLNFSDWLDELFLNVIADVFAGVVIIIVVYIWFKWFDRSEIAGKYSAYDIKEGQEEYWGEVTLTYNLFSKKVCGILEKEDSSAEIKINAVLEKDQYLRGYYIEKKGYYKRRMGAFLLMIDGEGKNYIGPYVYIDPEKDNYSPKVGKARWEKKDQT